MYTTIILSSLLAFAAAQLQSCAASSQTCTATLKTPAPSGTVCGTKGNVGSPSYAIQQCTTTTADACRTLCLSNANCLSYSWDSSSQACGIYNKGVGAQGFTASTSSTKTFYAKGCYTFSCTTPSTPSGTNRGVSIGFGAGYDPTENNNLSNVASVGLVGDDTYCNGGKCKRVVFGNNGGQHSTIINNIPIKTGVTRLFIKGGYRKLYNAIGCNSVIGATTFNADGTTTTDESEAQQISWGQYTEFQYIPERYTVDKVNVYYRITCGGTSDTNKPPTVYIDDLSVSVF